MRAGRHQHRVQRPGRARGAWLRPDAHVNTIGATAPNLREVDPETFARASSIVVDTEHAGIECGDIMAAEDAAAWPAERVMTLPDVVAADGSWTRPSGVSVFKSVGTPVQDLAAARAVASAAAALGVGREVDLLTPKIF